MNTKREPIRSKNSILYYKTEKVLKETVDTTTYDYYHIPIFFVTAIGGSFLGRKIVGRINQTTFKKIVLLSIILVSIKFIIDGTSSIFK